MSQSDDIFTTYAWVDWSSITYMVSERIIFVFGNLAVRVTPEQFQLAFKAHGLQFPETNQVKLPEEWKFEEILTLDCRVFNYKDELMFVFFPDIRLVVVPGPHWGTHLEQLREFVHRLDLRFLNN